MSTMPHLKKSSKVALLSQVEEWDLAASDAVCSHDKSKCINIFALEK